MKRATTLFRESWEDRLETMMVDKCPRCKDLEVVQEWLRKVKAKLKEKNCG